jgi:16S rRNA (uracil1498-N3)-methyltransferase
MHTPRFFCSTPLIAHSTLDLPPEVAHHLRVLRLKTGQTFTLFDGLGQEFLTQLTTDIRQASGSDVTTVELLAPTEVNRERSGQITLIQGLSSADKMDWVIEKAVELGVHRVIPVAAHRSVLRLDERRALKKHQHWQRIVQSASEQCGRNILMRVDMVCTLEQALKLRLTSADGMSGLFNASHVDRTNEVNQLNEAVLWVAHPNGAQTMIDCVQSHQQPIQAVDIAIGPEGGWSEQELTLFLKHPGTQTISLGPRVLRTETAGLAAVAMLGSYLRW